MEQLTGETEQQYIMRQTRIRDEAKARMAAKFGGGGLSSASSSSYGGSSSGAAMARPPAPSSGNSRPVVGMKLSSQPKPAPSSGNLSVGARTPPRKLSKDSMNSGDFFS